LCSKFESYNLLIEYNSVKNFQQYHKYLKMFNSSYNNEIVIDAQKVRKSFKTVEAVKGIDLKILGGQFAALLGPNGAGKTTLVEMIEGIQKPDSGEIYILGKQWKGNEDELHHFIGISLQETRFIDKLTVFETLKLFASFYRLSRQRVEEVIDLVGLNEKARAYVGNLSGGQRQRLALSIALINKPQIMLLDEPTTGLDPTARRELWDILLRLKDEGNTSLILTTHYMEEAEQLCDHIIIMDNGNILREGTLEQLIGKNGIDKTIEFTFMENPEDFEIAGFDQDLNIKWDAENRTGTISLNHIESELPRLFQIAKQQNLKLKTLNCRRITLDDLFISMTGRHLND
jgi:ABC-2 type transport system ATP-binding protein